MVQSVDQYTSKRDTMKICIIFHSYTGITRGIAERIKDVAAGDLIEVKPRKPYTTLTAYSLGCLRARAEEAEPIEPASIDVAPYDLIVIGTPVWAWKATPAINAAINALQNCHGKKAIIFATCGSQAGETLGILKRALERKQVAVIGESVLTRKDVADDQKIAGLIHLVTTARSS